MNPTDEDVKRAKKMCAWAGNGLEIFRHKLACEFAKVREEERARIADALDREAPEWQACSAAVSCCATKVRENLKMGGA